MSVSKLCLIPLDTEASQFLFIYLLLIIALFYNVFLLWHLMVIFIMSHFLLYLLPTRMICQWWGHANCTMNITGDLECTMNKCLIQRWLDSHLFHLQWRICCKIILMAIFLSLPTASRLFNYFLHDKMSRISRQK